MTKLRVTIVVDSDAYGGAERYAGHLLHGLPSGVRRSLVVSEAVADHFAGAAFPVAVVPLARHRERTPAIMAALAGFAPDVVLVNLVDPASNAAALWAG